VKTNAQLETDVLAELAWDASIKDVGQIAVSADHGRVTLRGTVGSLHQRRIAERAAKRVAGTIDVDNELNVQLMDDWARDDADIRGAALQALTWNASVPDGKVDVYVDAGHVTLTGVVDWRYEKEAAESTVAMLTGVVGVVNEIEVLAPAQELDVMSDQIERAFERNAQTRANAIRISVLDGRVTLSGDVSSWAERDAAMAAAAAAPGVRDVDDRLTVTG
jgi:osmotically-inducible protein OsmY